jgi:hypothetical protein
MCETRQNAYATETLPPRITSRKGVEWLHWLCSQNPAISPHKTPTRSGARGEDL